MRILTFLFVLLAGMAHAEVCEPPREEGTGLKGVPKYAACMNKAVAELQRENAELRETVEQMRDSLADIPGELTNDNGRVTRKGGENLVQATYSNSARKGQTASGLAIDQTALEAMCEVGCSLRLALTGEALRGADPPEVFADATCTLRYTARNGAWAQGGGCGDAVSGVDGDGKPPGKAGGEVLATVGEACILADAEPGRGVAAERQVLGADRVKGLYLIAAPALWKGEAVRFRCEMKIGR
jgi:hypothetical protein